jgi:hypothetical protein
LFRDYEERSNCVFYLYIMQHDKSGEGTRGTLLSFDSIEEANEEFNAAASDTDTILAKVIKGEAVKEYHTDILVDAPSSEEVLQASPLQDVDDLENKEGV